MKKLLLTGFFALTGAISLMAQESRGFYLKPTGSYFIKVTPVEFPAINNMPARDKHFMVNANGTTTMVSEKALTGSFGQGWRAGLVGGFQFNDVLALEVGFNYFQSESQDMMRQTGTMGNANVLSLHSVGKIKAMDVAPALVLSIPTKGSFKPYTKVGVIVPVGGYLQINTSIDDKTGAIAAQNGTPSLPGTHINLLLDREERINPNATIGFQAALGLRYKIAKTVSLFSELEYRNISVGGKDKALKKYNGTATVVVNATGTPMGTEQLTLANQPVGDKEVKYHKEITSAMNVKGTANYDSTKPSDDLRSYVNIGGLGINVGIKIGF
ncbi:outer membrane beta-barrel protein [Pedobacter sp. UBA4863]|uniref:outer membrane beta-barrel protein n=1 Tax=Pedobacter sp. UBA4863 TaxID=1947060 RepID=UPI0025E916C6|nr:outer membrane beta-barrel protein [Pedobacter sp. UBA4863]